MRDKTEKSIVNHIMHADKWRGCKPLDMKWRGAINGKNVVGKAHKGADSKTVKG